MIPKHIAIIMDGNGRWAESKRKPRVEGHQSGVENITRVVEIMIKKEVKFLTLFAFSTENWSRPIKEVEFLTGKLLAKSISSHTEKLNSAGVKILHLGKTDNLDENLKLKINNAIKLTQNNNRITLQIAFDYGGRQEIIEATKNILLSGIKSEELDEISFSRFLFTSEIPDPDLVIRTGGEFRISNFLLWQTAYSEFYSTETYWPDFDEEEINKALSNFSNRERRFGKLRNI
ncbi:MAG: polyprenyl diphosphate synthase [Dehalococcoidia bacterium]|nr:polyprenyl diphosphate synthase [Dehalococcoidia bacterium]